MKLVVGLGNIGSEYERTRHNVGFMVVDELVEKLGGKWQKNTKLEADICKLEDLVLMKPTTFMNDSGRAVQKVRQFYKVDLTELVVIHDDLDIKLGDYKIQTGKGPMIHNGILSIEECLGDKEFVRIRIGIDNREVRNETGKDYVLGRFSSGEYEKLESVIKIVVAELINGTF